MEIQPTLLPSPRALNYSEGVAILPEKRLILLDSDRPQSLLFSAIRIQAALSSQFRLDYQINYSKVVPSDLVEITLRVNPQFNVTPQGYSLNITSRGIMIESRDEQGIFYGACTLIQLIHYYIFFPVKNSSQPTRALPCMEILDWPDFPNRGVMLDISRDKVPTMKTIFNLVDLLASWKINQLQLYTEHTFAYQGHPEVWADASPFTGEEILTLDAYCRERFIELVPNQNSFGHLQHWLKLPRYKSLAEAPDGFDFPWGRHEGPFSLCPLDGDSINLISSLYDELLPHFSSHQVNVGCDETFDLGQGRSQTACAQIGTGRVYLDFLLKIYREVTNRGFSMQFWSDIIMAHPELIHEIPKDCIALEWGYEANHPFDEHGEKFTQAGLPFYVCPGTSSWNSIAGRTDNCIQNLSKAAIIGLKYGAQGYLITDWGDNGHWQVLPVSYLGFATGAAYSWSYTTNHSLDIREALNRYAFQDPSGNMGTIAYDLGNLYHEIGYELDNSTVLFQILQQPFEVWKDFLTPETATQVLNHTLEILEHTMRNLPNNLSLQPDKALLQQEFQLTADILRHACKRGLYGFGSSTISKSSLSSDLKKIIAEYKAIWLLRNRPGGLKDSLAHFKSPQFMKISGN